MTGGCLDTLPSASGIPRFPIAARIGLEVVPVPVAIALVARKRGTVTVSRLVILVTAADTRVVRLPVTPVTLIVVERIDFSAWGRSFASGGSPQLLHVHFAASDGIADRLGTLGNLLAHDDLFDDTCRLRNHRLFDGLANFDRAFLEC